MLLSNEDGNGGEEDGTCGPTDQGEFMDVDED